VTDGRAQVVKDLAGEPALAEWLEVRPARSIYDLRREDLEWADLLVAVDAEAARGFPAERPVNCRLKRWELPSAGSTDVEAAALQALQCMVGGMRMLSRMDAEDV